MGKVLWIAEHERACEDLASDGDRDLFTSRMKALGFDQDEISDHIDAILEES